MTLGGIELQPCHLPALQSAQEFGIIDRKPGIVNFEKVRNPQHPLVVGSRRSHGGHSVGQPVSQIFAKPLQASGIAALAVEEFARRRIQALRASLDK